MRRMIVAFIIIFVGALVAAPNRAVAQTADTAAEAQAIREISRQWVAMVATKDPAAVVKFYTDDGVLLPQGAVLAEGHDAIAKVWRGYFDLPDFSLTFSPTPMSPRRGTWLMKSARTRLGFRSDKGPVHEKGKYVVVWKKVGATWKAAADIFNSDGPAP